LKLRRVKPKERGIVCRLDDERVLEVDHATCAGVPRSGENRSGHQYPQELFRGSHRVKAGGRLGVQELGGVSPPGLARSRRRLISGLPPLSQGPRDRLGAGCGRGGALTAGRRTNQTACEGVAVPFLA
jgi:hypothetical protein